VTQLRKMTLDEIALRNYTEGTTRIYLATIEGLACYFHRSPDQLGPEQIREYTVHLFGDKHLSENLVGNGGSETHRKDRRRTAPHLSRFHDHSSIGKCSDPCGLEVRFTENDIPCRSSLPIWLCHAPHRRIDACTG
jgi:Phage integrase, N-terminal SAM-like domain